MKTSPSACWCRCFITAALTGTLWSIGTGAEARTTGATRTEARTQLLQAVDHSWNGPVPQTTPPPATGPGVAPSPLAEKLDRIVLPTVSFNQVEMTRVAGILSAAAEEFDRTGSDPKGVNIVLLDPAGKCPAITLTLRNLPLRRVLDLVAAAAGCRCEVQPDAVVLRPAGDAAELDMGYFPVARGTVLRMLGAGAGRAETGATRPAGGDESEGIRGFLQQAGIVFDRVPGASLVYDGDSLIVSQTARNLERIRGLLARYRDVRQVEIEAKFMEVQEGALEELGVNWHVTRRGLPQLDPTTGAPIVDAHGRQVFTPQEVYDTAGTNRSLAQALTSSQTSGAILVDGERVASTAAPRLPGANLIAENATPLASIAGFVGEFDVAAVVRALAQRQGTDLLSAPKVTVLSGNAATITVAQEMRYPQSYGEIQSQVGTAGGQGSGSAGVTITSGTPQNFATRNVGVELRVLPTVEEDNRAISLDLHPKVTEFEGFVEYGGPSLAISGGRSVTVPPGFYQPIFSVREVATKVTLWDGATLVMGGLTREEVKTVNDKVPILGDIPLLGRLFRSKGESSQKRNLLIFVTASLLNPGGASRQLVAALPPASVTPVAPVAPASR